MMPHYDIIIVGAGPAGASSAIIAAQSGLNVLLCDKMKFPREKICGDCINPKIWPLLNLLRVSEKVKSQPFIRLENICVINSAGKQINGSVSAFAENPFIAMK